MADKSKLPKSALAALDLYCRKASARTLKRLAFSLGAALGVNKSSLRNNILTQAHALEELSKIKLAKGKVCITSIDLGISNFAYAKFELSSTNDLPKLMDWNKFHLEEQFLQPYGEKMSLHPTDTSQVVYDLCEFLTSQADLPDMFTIERQRARSMSSRAILEPILKVNILEQILFSNLINKTKCHVPNKLDYMVVSSDPQRMTSFWTSFAPIIGVTEQPNQKDSKDMNPKNSSNRLSKSIKIDTVKHILQGAVGIGDNKMIQLLGDWEARLGSFIPGNPKFKITDCVPLGPTAGVRKDDDLADSFLHGLAWMEWFKFYEQIRKILLKESGKYDQGVLEDFNKHIKNNKFDFPNLQLEKAK